MVLKLQTLTLNSPRCLRCLLLDSRHVFAQHGIHNKLVSNNGQQLTCTSKELPHFLHQTHMYSIIYYPATNCNAESFLQTAILAEKENQAKLASFHLEVCISRSAIHQKNQTSAFIQKGNRITVQLREETVHVPVVLQ